MNNKKEVFNEIRKLKKQFEAKPITPPEVEKVYTDKSGKMINVKTLGDGNLVINGELFKIYKAPSKANIELKKQSKAKQSFKDFQENIKNMY